MIALLHILIYKCFSKRFPGLYTNTYLKQLKYLIVLLIMLTMVSNIQVVVYFITLSTKYIVIQGNKLM